MNTSTTLTTSLSLLLLASASASAAIVGNPLADAGWSKVGNTLDKTHYVDKSGNFDADVYTTAFTLDPSSPLVTTLNGDSWAAGDTIVGVGGVFVTTIPTQNGWTGATYATTPNSNVTYNGTGTVAPNGGPGGNGATSTRIVVKYAATASPTLWKTSTTAPTPGSGGDASLSDGGVGSLLLGTNPYDFGPADPNTLIATTDAPTIVGSSGQVVLTSSNGGDLGQAITDWTTGPNPTLVAFESFLDISLLNRKYGSSATPPSVALGNAFDLDLQRGTDTSLFTDSEFTLPSTLATPEPASLALLALGAASLLTRRRPQSPA